MSWNPTACANGSGPSAHSGRCVGRILTGARLSEILTAKWEYLDWERGALNLPDSKTGKKTIYLSAAALAVFKAIPKVLGNPCIIPGEKRKKKGERQPLPSPRADLKRP